MKLEEHEILISNIQKFLSYLIFFNGGRWPGPGHILSWAPGSSLSAGFIICGTSIGKAKGLPWIIFTTYSTNRYNLIYSYIYPGE